MTIKYNNFDKYVPGLSVKIWRGTYSSFQIGAYVELSKPGYDLAVPVNKDKFLKEIGL